MSVFKNSINPSNQIKGTGHIIPHVYVEMTGYDDEVLYTHVKEERVYHDTAVEVNK